MTTNKTDATIDEIHRVRREISERFDGDVFAIAADAARRQEAFARPVWNLAGMSATDQAAAVRFRRLMRRDNFSVPSLEATGPASSCPNR